MKLTLLLLMAIMTSNITASADEQGHLLVNLWGKYEKAVLDDRPKEQLSTLEEIKRQAKEKHLTYDFCDAARKYADVRSSMNWKLRDSLERRLDEELEEFGEPAAMIFASRKYLDADSLEACIRANSGKLLSSSNRTLYSNDYRITGSEFGSILPSLIKNDLEYALWCLQRSWSPSDSARELIAEGLGRRYPMNALHEFCTLSGKQPEEQELKAFEDKYSGKAAALLASHALLERRFSELNRNDGSSTGYINLFKDCKALSEAAKNFQSDEKLIAGICEARAEALSSQLEDREIFACTGDGMLKIQLRNLKSARVRIFSGDKELYSRTLDNPSCSFYTLDSLEMELPELADGTYSIKLSSGKDKTEIQHLQYSISLAMKLDSEGPAVYAADYMSGKPLEWCSLVLRDENGNTAAEIARLDLKGFTRLPYVFTGHFPKLKWNYTIQASFTAPDGSTRLSRELSLSPYIFSSDSAESDINQDDNAEHCVLLTDRKAFNPGETVNFKAILYNGDFSLTPAGEGISITAKLLDPEGKELSSAQLTTNEFSSAAGSFVLTKSRLGGLYTIRIERQEKVIASTNVLADEFVLPTFDLQWENDDKLHLPGDTVEIKGNIKAYSGHSLSSADITYRLTSGPGDMVSGPLETDAEGNFSIKFKASEKHEYDYRIVTVRATDATGETREFSNGINIQPEIPLEITPDGESEGDFIFKDDPDTPYRRQSRYIFAGNEARFHIGTGEDTKRPDARISFRLSSYEGKPLHEGIISPGELKLRLEGSSSGIYRLDVEARATSHSGEEFARKDSILIARIPDSATKLQAPGIMSFFHECEGPGLSLQIGATCGPVWAVAELHGSGNRLLDRTMVHLTGKAGEQGSLETISFTRHENYPPDLSIMVFYFRDKQSFEYTRDFDFRSTEAQLPLSFTRFLDTTSPSNTYTFLIRTDAGVECAASIFDAASETLMQNLWNKVQPWAQYGGPEASYSSICGTDESQTIPLYLRGSAKGIARSNSSVLYSAVPQMGLESEVLYEDAVTAEQAPAQAGSGLHVRKDFESTLAWEPFLRSDENGEIRFEFNTSDKLSLYHVQLFAHDRNFRNNTLRRDMTVTLPVKISAVQPQFLYESDTWNARIGVSNMTDSEVSGKVSVSFLGGSSVTTDEVLKSGSGSLSLSAGGSGEFSLTMKTPETDTLGVLISFIPDEHDYGSDAVFVTIPVKKPVQTITESHSALWKPGMDKETVISGLRDMFVNTNGGTASVSEISILEMLKEAIPENLQPEGEDVLSLSAALWADSMLASLEDMGIQRLSDAQKAELEEKIRSCANRDGGFGWFAGMNSSPAITAVLLERFHGMGPACPSGISEILPAAVKYMDKEMFSNKVRPLWCGGLSLPQYLLVRSLYASIPLETGDFSRKELKEYRKAVKDYLAPGRQAGLGGQILPKARRLLTIQALLSGKDGIKLAGKLGISGFTAHRLKKTYSRDVASLVQYAEPHASGGIYYPNAVMPWRGLLESELYAHSLLCRLMESCGHTEIAEGIRLWIMVQKETQQWKNDPGYIEALSCVMQGSQKTLDTKVIVLSASRKLPFGMIEAAGNGFSIEREFFLDGKKVAEGDTLHVGDKLTAVYRIWNQENRSFVKVSIPRNAALRPADQSSGHYGWMARPLSLPGWTSFTPQGYRSVKSDRTEYWFDSYPEEKTSITEEFFVTQEGTFQSPVPEIESLYAPHWRANGKGESCMMTVSGN